MKKTLSIPYQIMLIIVAVLAVYYPTQFGEISLVDDLGAISAFFSPEHISFADLFIPRSAGGGYYRPLIGVSFWLDKQLWFLDEHLLHFEGVLAHLLNGLLVYFVCREAVCLYLKEKQTYLPLVSALLFSLHPINTESVNWISGRTDVMMATFVLLSMYCLLRYLQNRSKLLLFFVFFFAVIALLAKETAFGYLVGLTLLVTLQPDEQIAKHEDDITKRKINIYIFITYYVCASLSALFLGSYWLVLLICFFYCMHIACKRCSVINCIHSCYQTFKPFVTLMVTLAGSIVLAVFLRKIAFTSSVGKIGQTVTLMLGDLNYTLSLFLRSAGFYVKKFFIPVPLIFIG